MQLTSIGRLRLVSFLAVGVIAGSALVYGCGDDDDTTTTPPKSDASTSETSTGTDSGGGTDTGTPPDTGTPDTGPTTVTAVANITTTSDGGVTGTATFTQTGTGPVTVNITISGASDGLHGMHIHQNGNCGDDGDGGAPGTGAGGHWSISDAGHGLPDGSTMHIGDMGNISISGGTGTLMLTKSDWTIDPTTAMNSVVGHAVIFHANPDDGTPPVGNAGGRPGCGIIQKQ